MLLLLGCDTEPNHLGTIKCHMGSFKELPRSFVNCYITTAQFGHQLALTLCCSGKTYLGFKCRIKGFYLCVCVCICVCDMYLAKYM